MDIGVNIRKYRKNKKLTQEQLADVLNVTVGAVSNLLFLNLCLLYG